MWRVRGDGCDIELATGNENTALGLAKEPPSVHVLIDGRGKYGAAISINHLREIIHEVGQGIRVIRGEEYVDVTKDGAVAATFMLDSGREAA